MLAEEASKIASTYSDVFTATILDVEKCKELKMGSYLGVAAASANPPHFIHLCYKPTDGNVKRKLAIVGKGLTFDRFVVLATEKLEVSRHEDGGLFFFLMLDLPMNPVVATTLRPGQAAASN